ncbi:Two-component sensor histidine kinase, contains HisKA and HATPase domains [Kaistia soli DSM 19436]|uniref:Two-component sensor histidine kinase, contains HisKA and HATPase domains n=1 Tax=Kaistia soli DSM 19436 TaxID=1122133 RepID=A0A1M4ZL35_9HYPH|nr:histidine kinase dimerization/phosphoacceptor domain -containing protein [Kaistia soli]SHF18790.1 Two-component sensor histidine kinase, contains HisKA and HATPase domains [Kaistia soli DSM 19436]
MEAGKHSEEARRIAALHRYDILDTPTEREFDEVVRVVSAICNAPISVINLIDEHRQWFKAEVGLGVRETPLPASICAHAILQDDFMLVPDTLDDIRFAGNPLVLGSPHLRFYAGALLKTPEGLPIGTICVLDTKPRGLDANQQALLRLMASQIMKLIESRQLVIAEQAARLRAEQLAEENETLARESDHRVMNSLQQVSSVLSMQARGVGGVAKAELDSARHRVDAIALVHRQLHLARKLTSVDAAPFLRQLSEQMKASAPARIEAITVDVEDRCLAPEWASALGLIVAELIANSIKHAFPGDRRGTIAIRYRREGDASVLSVEDDGVGLPAGFDPAKSKGVGMRVIVAKARRIGAELTSESIGGRTTFRLRHSG